MSEECGLSNQVQRNLFLGAGSLYRGTIAFVASGFSYVLSLILVDKSFFEVEKLHLKDPFNHEEIFSSPLNVSGFIIEIWEKATE